MSSKSRKEKIAENQKIIKKAVRPMRRDGYINVLTRYGTQQDSSENYSFHREPIVPDERLTELYEGHGLFSVIIDTPANEATKHGFNLGLADSEMTTFIDDSLEELDWEAVASTAVKWSRLYGGAIIVMLIDDGGGLEEPLNWGNIKSIDELRVYERPVVQPDYSSMYREDFSDGETKQTSRYNTPEFYDVFSIYGTFRVHESRCLVLKNGVLPERTTYAQYRLWGLPEHQRMHRALKETTIAHESGTKLLERSVQAIYKMTGLADLLSMDGGEDEVLKRFVTIDKARSYMNSIIIDSNGEDYDFKTFQFSGIRDVIDGSSNMLSAITRIPQTVLFGKGVGGLSTTDDTSMENYYNYIESIQKLMLKKNLKKLIDILFKAGAESGEVDSIPQYKLKFNPLWSLNETESTANKKVEADTQYVLAQTSQLYVEMQALDVSEVRKGLANSEEYLIENLVDEEDDDMSFLDYLTESGGDNQWMQPKPEEQPKMPQSPLSEGTNV